MSRLAYVIRTGDGCYMWRKGLKGQLQDATISAQVEDAESLIDYQIKSDEYVRKMLIEGRLYFEIVEVELQIRGSVSKRTAP